MTERRSSSTRGPGICDAVLMMDDRPVGLMRLPMSRADDFVDHFNRTYAGLGMQLAPLEATSGKGNIPDSKNTAGDVRFSD